jgi:lipopolysaccharide transport system ATP-binding protein
MDNEHVLICDSLSKDYTLWKDSSSRLKAPIWSLLGRAFQKSRKENPYYSTFRALNNVNFKLKRGESIGIIGRNGSGKSTLLQILAGTLQPTTGSVNINGRIAALLELGSGFNPEFTGRENIYIYASILGYSRKETDAIYNSIVDFSELEEFIDQPLRTYSSGMMIRLAFSVRIHLNPEILIIDEALAVGDFSFVQKCTRFIREYIKNKTLILVTHDLPAVQNLCDRCLWLKDGNIAFDGNPKEAVEKYLAECQAETDFKKTLEQTSDSKTTISAEMKDHESEFFDQRTAPLRQLRPNDWSVILLNEPADSFGTGTGNINECFLENLDGKRLNGLVGGELVRLVIKATANEKIENPILGFNLKDRLGQYIFGDNTYLANRDTPLRLFPNQSMTAIFEFRMPILHPSEYAFAVALATGSQDAHEQIQWIHEALIIQSNSPITHQGLCGIPMLKISTTIK